MSYIHTYKTKEKLYAQNVWKMKKKTTKKQQKTLKHRTLYKALAFVCNFCCC